MDTTILHLPDVWKEVSIDDFAIDSLLALEDQVTEKFPDETDPDKKLHIHLMGTLVFAMLFNGCEKEELLNIVKWEVDSSHDYIAKRNSS